MSSQSDMDAIMSWIITRPAVSPSGGVVAKTSFGIVWNALWNNVVRSALLP